VPVRPFIDGCADSSKRGKRGFWSKQAEEESRPFPPSHKNAEEALAALLERIRRSPEDLMPSGGRSRWQLSLFKEAFEWMKLLSLSGIWRILNRLGIALKRGRAYIHSPDPQYREKLAAVENFREQAKRSRGREVVLYTDEISYYRQPEVSRDYEERGSKYQPRAGRSHRSNTLAREAAALNPSTGEVIHHGASRLGVTEMLRFYRQILEAYPRARRIYLIEDNWPLHYHPNLLCYLEDQQTGFPLKVPSTWRKAEVLEQSRRTRESLKRGELLPIQIVPLPTYAPWTNPVEKFWRKFRQEFLHLHRKADEWEELKRGVKGYMDKFRAGSRELLRYVGLTPKQTGRRSRAAAVAHSPP
jgi:hypothetical protein